MIPKAQQAVEQESIFQYIFEKIAFERNSEAVMRRISGKVKPSDADSNGVQLLTNLKHLSVGLRVIKQHSRGSILHEQKTKISPNFTFNIAIPDSFVKSSSNLFMLDLVLGEDIWFGENGIKAHYFTFPKQENEDVISSSMRRLYVDLLFTFRHIEKTRKQSQEEEK